ncbi:MAG: hypothetical protein DI539_11385 [Flavobacterium psychrophilum]|nr:MAG: hypothetical protein DI539_11385 [Flavobacterium psychrophilum]
MIENLATFLYGKEYADRMEKFHNGASEIENKNLELFEDKKLSDYYMVSTFQNNTVKIELIEDTLPPRIVKEIMDLFGSLFPKP